MSKTILTFNINETVRLVVYTDENDKVYADVSRGGYDVGVTFDLDGLEMLYKMLAITFDFLGD